MNARAIRWLFALSGLAALACVLGLAAGSAGFGFVSPDIVWQVRLPRVLAGFGTGAALALAGALMQLLTRNALADPYVLGVSSGAAVGALGAMMLGTVAGLPLGWMLAAGASLGAFAATAMLLGLSWRAVLRSGIAGAQESPVTLLLIGVMIGSGASAVVAMLLALAPDAQLRGMVFWLLGDLNGATQWALVWLATAVALALTWPRARDLDLMARGDVWATTLGVDVARRRRVALAAAALATGAAVATAGAIGFVGLVVPHTLRLLRLREAAHLLPASALAGGAFIVLVDTAARTMVAPVQLPVGVLAAVIGVPAFLWLLLQRPRSGPR